MSFCAERVALDLSMKRELQKLRKALKQPMELVATEIAEGFSHFRAKNKVYSLLDNPSKGSKKVYHIAHYTLSNAGDIILPVVIRDFLSLQDSSLRWKKQHVHTVVDDASTKKLNSAKGFLIGGGGLFISDTNKNKLSGWQWSCSYEQLEQLDSPFVLFAVGYNQFRNQAGFQDIFGKHIHKLTEKALYIGLRNEGSIASFRQHLPTDLHAKVRFQPCLTTIIKKIYPALSEATKKEDFIAVNCAFDRSKNRFGKEMGTKLSRIAKALAVLSKDRPIKYYAHTKEDQYFLPYLDVHEVPFELVKLYNVTSKTIVEAYTKPALVMGMRGHAQLIAFGCGTPTISLISHNKLKFFLEDIGKPEWGLEVDDPALDEKITALSQEMLAQPDSIVAHIDSWQQKFYEVSLTNAKEFLEYI